MDTQLLTAFTAVAEHGSFSIAAKQLDLTQSAISKRIALLEQQLSNSLFDRAGRRIYLTEAGHILLPRAKKILDAVDDTKRLMEQQQNSVRGKLKIATSHHIGIHRLPSILKDYTNKYPGVYLQLHFLDSEQAIHAINRGDFDLAIITLPEALNDDDDSQLQSHLLWNDPMKIVANSEHILCNKPSLTINDLSKHPAILPDLNTRTTQLVKALFSREESELTIAMTTNHLDAIKMMVSVGLGWSALPERLIDKTLHELPISNAVLNRSLGCIHHRYRTLSNAARAMLKELKKTSSSSFQP